VRRIRRAVELRRNAARRDLWHLQVALSWCSEQSRSDLEPWVFDGLFDGLMG